MKQYTKWIKTHRDREREREREGEREREWEKRGCVRERESVCVMKRENNELETKKYKYI